MSSIKYQNGYEYQLFETYIHPLPDSFGKFSGNKDFFLSLDGKTLTIAKGYAWDGASGPPKLFHTQTPNTMRGSLVHDALYQLIRENIIPEAMKDACDRELQKILIEDGMGSIRAWTYYQGVHLFGYSSTVGQKPIIKAP